MGKRTIAQLAAAGITAVLLAAPIAHAQPEYLRLDPGGNQHNVLWFDTDGEVLAWTESPGAPAGLTTHIWRRMAAGWAPEAEFHTPSPEEGALTLLHQDRVVMRGGWGELRIWRHGANGWAEERIDYGRNDPVIWTGTVAIDGNWLAMPLRTWGHWDLPLAALFHFDGAAWRFHSEVNAPTEPLQAAQWLEIEGDVLAMQLVDASTHWDPGPVLIFRLRDGKWVHEQTLPVKAWWVAVDGGRIAILQRGALDLVAESTPGLWEVESSIKGEHGPYVLDGDTLVALQRGVPAQADFDGRAVVYRRHDTGWERTRVLYPSNAYSMERGGSEQPYSLFTYGTIGHAGGEVFAITAEGEPWHFEGWRIVGFPACRADFNGDGVADIADLYAFLEGQAQYMLSTDYNMNDYVGPWDEGDLLEFMRLLEEGC